MYLQVGKTVRAYELSMNESIRLREYRNRCMHKYESRSGRYVCAENYNTRGIIDFQTPRMQRRLQTDRMCMVCGLGNEYEHEWSRREVEVDNEHEWS